ncbi:MAG: 3-oxoacyl-ACP reductase FabG [Bacteroidetes bacterium]|nr:3-oxoacyl-ACP reductase FabG [Bacteroidota bacterium]
MKTALVTGGSRGIGKAISVRLGRDGYYVIVNYRSNGTEAADTLEKIRNAGGEGELLQFDVSDPDEVNRALDKWHGDNHDKQITILVNNAGLSRDNLMVFMSDQDWKDVMSTNLDSFFYVTRYLLQNMLVGKWGRIINIVSLSGQKGLPGQVNYSASKGAVIAATKSLAMEIGKKKVTVNAVAPGFIRTDMTADLDEKQLSAMVPLRRFGEPEEVAEVVSFLVSEGASYITGETISVNGGMHS